MTTKPTGLAAFTKGKAATIEGVQGVEAEPAPKPRGRRRAQGETVALTVRLGKDDWRRLHQLATAEGVSLQSLALDGLSLVFARRGLPPIAP
jgi:hypothetical protein